MNREYTFSWVKLSIKKYFLSVCLVVCLSEREYISNDYFLFCYIILWLMTLLWLIKYWIVSKNYFSRFLYFNLVPFCSLDLFYRNKSPNLLFLFLRTKRKGNHVVFIFWIVCFCFVFMCVCVFFFNVQDLTALQFVTYNAHFALFFCYFKSYNGFSSF